MLPSRSSKTRRTRSEVSPSATVNCSRRPFEMCSMPPWLVLTQSPPSRVRKTPLVHFPSSNGHGGTESPDTAISPQGILTTALPLSSRPSQPAVPPSETFAGIPGATRQAPLIQLVPQTVPCRSSTNILIPYLSNESHCAAEPRTLQIEWGG